MIYRVYTENKNKDKIIEAFTASFDGFTVFEGQGFWRGVAEPSIVIEMLTSDSVTLHKVCEWVKWYNKQEAVLIVAIQETSELI